MTHMYRYQRSRLWTLSATTLLTDCVDLIGACKSDPFSKDQYSLMSAPKLTLTIPHHLLQQALLPIVPVVRLGPIHVPPIFQELDPRLVA